MKKIGIMVVAVSLVLSLTALAGEKSANTQTQTPGNQGAQEVRGKIRGKALETPGALEKEIATVKQQQKATIDELQDIKKLATEEKATKTVGALDKLIARHNQEFQKKIDALQQRLEKLKGAQKSTTQKETKTAPKKGGTK